MCTRRLRVSIEWGESVESLRSLHGRTRTRAQRRHREAETKFSRHAGSVNDHRRLALALISKGDNPGLLPAGGVFLLQGLEAIESPPFSPTYVRGFEITERRPGVDGRVVARDSRFGSLDTVASVKRLVSQNGSTGLKVYALGKEGGFQLVMKHRYLLATRRRHRTRHRKRVVRLRPGGDIGAVRSPGGGQRRVDSGLSSSKFRPELILEVTFNALAAEWLFHLLYNNRVNDFMIREFALSETLPHSGRSA